MIEIKVSQGAKPGHGGILPAAKVTAEIAEARLVPQGKDVFSPTYHKAFSTPLEMVAFIARLRELCDGKPVGFKICIGDPREFMAIVKAMIQTGIYADFIVVDGGEGGTGAAPLEFSDSLGAPLNEGLLVVQNTLVGAGIRDRFKIGASGKMVTASAMARSMALGADWCNSARAFMFAVGCIQSQRCHTNQCPVGVTTQDPKLQRALNVPDKATRVHNYHKNTVHALAEMIAAMGLDHTSELGPQHVVRRVTQFQALALYEIYDFVEPGHSSPAPPARGSRGSGTRPRPSRSGPGRRPRRRRTPAEQAAPKRAGLVLTALILGAAVANLNLAVANVALPSIGQAFDSSQTSLNLIAVGYSLGLAASVLYLGAVGDRYGRKLLLVLGIALSIPACLLAAYAPSDTVLIIARIFGGVSAGMAYPTTLALIAALWSGPGRTKTIALWSALGGAISSLGPLMSRASCSSTSGGARSSWSRCRWRWSRW